MRDGKCPGETAQCYSGRGTFISQVQTFLRGCFSFFVPQQCSQTMGVKGLGCLGPVLGQASQGQLLQTGCKACFSCSCDLSEAWRWTLLAQASHYICAPEKFLSPEGQIKTSFRDFRIHRNSHWKHQVWCGQDLARNQQAGLGRMLGEWAKSSLINERVALDDGESLSHEKASQIRLMLEAAGPGPLWNTQRECYG